jgi:hypothetical protein
MLVQQNRQWMMCTLVMLLLALTVPAWAGRFPWAFDKTEGIVQGRRVADYVFTHAFVPLR